MSDFDTRTDVRFCADPNCSNLTVMYLNPRTCSACKRRFCAEHNPIEFCGDLFCVKCGEEARRNVERDEAEEFETAADRLEAVCPGRE